jgi:hypothetical protein
MQEFQKEIESINEMTIQDAKSGEIKACYDILLILHRIYCLIHDNKEEQIQRFDQVSEDYEPTERTLRPMIRWLFQKAKSLHLGNTERLNEWIRICSDPNQITIASSIIEILCNGTIYTFLDNVFLQKQDDILDLSQLDKKNEFLDHLVEKGLLHIQSDAIREMIHDQNPFYESIHINIISAFMDWETKSVEIDDLVSYMDKIFPNFNSKNTYPFDMEDCLLMWMNQCFSVVKKQYDLNDMESFEFEDITKDIDDGWMLCYVVGHYFNLDVSGIIAKEQLNRSEKLQNYFIFDRMMSECDIGVLPSWSPNDMVSQNTNRNGSQRYVYSGNASYLFINFLTNLFQVISEKGLPFKLKKSKKSKSGQKKVEKVEAIKEIVAVAQKKPQEPTIVEQEDFEELDPVVNFVSLPDVILEPPVLTRQDAYMDLFKTDQENPASSVVPNQNDESILEENPVLLDYISFKPVEETECIIDKNLAISIIEEACIGKEETSLDVSLDIVSEKDDIAPTDVMNPIESEVLKEAIQIESKILEQAIQVESLADTPIIQVIQVTTPGPEAAELENQEQVQTLKKYDSDGLNVPLTIPPISPQHPVALARESSSNPKRRKKKKNRKAIEEHIKHIMDEEDARLDVNAGVYQAPGVTIIDSYKKSREGEGSNESLITEEDRHSKPSTPLQLPKLSPSTPQSLEPTFQLNRAKQLSSTPSVTSKSQPKTPDTKVLPPLEHTPIPKPMSPIIPRHSLPNLHTPSDTNSRMNDLFANLELEITQLTHQLEEEKQRSLAGTPAAPTHSHDETVKPKESIENIVINDVNESGTIVINKEAMSLLLDSDTESAHMIRQQTPKPVPVSPIEGSETEQEEMDSDEDTNSYYFPKAEQEQVSTASFMLAEPKSVVFQATPEPKSYTRVSPTNFVSRPRSMPQSDSDSESEADFFELYEKPDVSSPPDQAEKPMSPLLGTASIQKEPSPEPVQPTAQPKRPRTGLQSYPIAETDAELAQRLENEGSLSWDRARARKPTPPTKPKPAKVSRTISTRSIKSTVSEEKVQSPQPVVDSTPKKRLSALDKPKIHLKKELVAKSNRVLIKNALMHVCLAGTVNKSIKEQVLKVFIHNAGSS